TTETDRADGAQTAKYVPLTPSTSMRCEPSFSYNLKCFPALNKSISKSENKLWDTTLVITTLFNLKIGNFNQHCVNRPPFFKIRQFTSAKLKNGTLFEILLKIRKTNAFQLNANN